MKQVDIETFEELEIELGRLNTFLISLKKEESHTHISAPIFRGQNCATWELQTTLERYLDKEISLQEYNWYLQGIVPAVESYTEKSWPFDSEPLLDVKFISNVPNYEFMTYTRHHGFPSPLLDWTESVYIALFFAFRNASVEGRVAIYSYVEDLGRGKSGCVGAPQIVSHGPYVSTHKRHFIQQGQYTVCIEKNDSNEWVYCSHEKVFSNNMNTEQDFLMKFTLPVSIKNQVLKKLNSMNINAFTLYGTEEGLMEKLAFTEIMKMNF